MTVIIGCDPGKSGAIAALTFEGRLIGVDDMPVVGQIISPVLLDRAVHNYIDPVLFDQAVHNYIDPLSIRQGHAVVEDVHAMPKQGVTSVFSFGRSLGVAEGCLACNGLALHYVSPARWKKALGLSSDKGVSRRRAIELWPASAELFKRVKDDGRAEAALLAYWWLHHGDQGSAA